MNGHGGARKNAGRKPVEPSLGERLVIGSRCEELRDTAAYDSMIAKAEMKNPERKKIRDAQRAISRGRDEMAAMFMRRAGDGAQMSTLRVLKKEFERYQAIAIARTEQEITPVLERIGRLIDAEKFRPKRMTRAEVCRKVAREYLEQGRPEITSRRVKAYWTEYGNFKKQMNAT